MRRLRRSKTRRRQSLNGRPEYLPAEQAEHFALGHHQIDRIDTYARYLRDNIQELDLLFKELLIGVTSFFRDPQAWAALISRVLPDLLAAHPGGRVLRAWIAGFGATVAFLGGFGLCAIWAFDDQRRRCPVCRHPSRPATAAILGPPRPPPQPVPPRPHLHHRAHDTRSL